MVLLRQEDFRRINDAPHMEEVTTDGFGVDPALITKWKQLANRPFNGKTSEPINNPLGLIRPHGVGSRQALAQALQDKPRPDRGCNINTLMDDYRYIVKAYERLTIIVLESLNELDLEKRRQVVKSGLHGEFNDSRARLIFNRYPTETARAWLVNIVLSLLDNHSQAIHPIGRIRALELLQLYPISELSLAFRPHPSEQIGYDHDHEPRLPHTLTSREERLMAAHRDIWAEKIGLNARIVVDSSGIVDWEQTATVLRSTYPAEAIQIALLLLHDSATTEGALGLLCQVARLDQQTRAKMFGSRATFLIEHRLKEGHQLENLIYPWMGFSVSPLAEALRPTDRDQLLNIADARIKLSEEKLFRQTVSHACSLWELDQVQQQNHRQAVENLHWRSGQTPPELQPPNSLDEIDPLGYYRALKLHPQLFKGLSEEDIEEMIIRHWWFSVQNPDVAVNEAQMRLLKEAYDFLISPKKREIYGKGLERIDLLKMGPAEHNLAIKDAVHLAAYLRQYRGVADSLFLEEPRHPFPVKSAGDQDRGLFPTPLHLLRQLAIKNLLPPFRDTVEMKGGLKNRGDSFLFQLLPLLPCQFEAQEFPEKKELPVFPEQLDLFFLFYPGPEEFRK